MESYSQVAFSLVDITNRLSVTHSVLKIDRCNGYFNQADRTSNPKETQIDYEAVEQYYESSEAIMDLEEKYFN